jgi:hypothetical protein
MRGGPNILRILVVSFCLAGCGGGGGDPIGTVGEAPLLPTDDAGLPNDDGGNFDPADGVDGRIDPPANPAEPTEPTDPNEPSEPSDPGEPPTDPVPSEPPPSEPPPSEPPPSEPPPSAPPPSEPPPPPPPPPPPSAPPPSGALSVASLGALPAELSGLRWPTRPSTSREVTATNAAQINAEARVSGTRIRVVGAVGGDITINANDVEIIADGATSLGRVTIARGIQRVRVEGGRYTGFFLSYPAQWPGPTYQSSWMIEDVAIENVSVAASDMAFDIRGRRIAIARSRITAGRYSVWCGDTGPMQTEDLILFDNVFNSAGPEATVRFVSVLRSAVVSNTLVNTFKHNYRVHGVSDLNFAADNLLINTGVMLGRMAGDSLGRVWFDDNVFHHTAPDLFNPDTAISRLYARRNTVHDNGHATFYGGAMSAGWDVSSNVMGPYTAPPAY